MRPLSHWISVFGLLIAALAVTRDAAVAQDTWDDPVPDAAPSDDAADAGSTAPDPAEPDPAEPVPDIDPTAAGVGAGGAPVPVQFALDPRRPIALRLRPDVGFRLPARSTAYSPRPPDYFGIARQPGRQFAIAATFDVFGASGAEDSAKAQEFRDLEGGLAVGVDAFLRDRRNYVRLTGRHLGLRDQDAKLEWRRPGLLVARADFSQIPHNFAFGATSLYQGVGTGDLTIDDEIQATLQGSTDFVDAAVRARDAVERFGRPVDLRHRRDRTGLRVDFVPTELWALTFQLKDESRVGTRPWSAGFGLRSAVEIPWPLDWNTEDLRVGFEYFGATRGLLFSGEYRHQTFTNDISSVRFDNPYRLTDSSAGNPQNQTFADGPSSGLIDLYPDNEHEQLTLTAVKRDLPKRTTLMATVSWGSSDQDDPLVPFTTNTAVVPGATQDPPFDFSDPANLPLTSANAAVDTRLVHLRLTSRPLDFLDVRAQIRDYDLDNESALIEIPGFVPEDALFRTSRSPTGLINLPIAHAETTTELEAGFRLPKRTKLSLLWKRQETDREFREVERATEETFKLSFDAKPASWVEVRASLLLADREISDYVFDQFFERQNINVPRANPLLRKFLQAARERDRVQLLAHFHPTETLSLSTQWILGTDDYTESPLGMTGDDHRLLSFDLTWMPTPRVALYGAWSVEKNEVALVGREWFIGAPSDPLSNAPELDDPSNWRAATEDEIDTIGFGLEADLIPDRLRFEVAFSWSESDGRIDYQSPVGPPSLDLNAFVPAPFEEVDDVRFWNLNPELEYTFGDHLALTLAYARERYDIEDFNLEGFSLVPIDTEGATNGAIFMGTQFTDYDFDLWSLRLKVSR